MAKLPAQAFGLWPTHASPAQPMRAWHAVETRGRARSGHGGKHGTQSQRTADSTTAKVSNQPSRNGHWTSAYMPRQENLGGEARKGCSPGEALLRPRGCRRRGDASEGPKEWMGQPEKWSGRSSLAARSSLRGQWGGQRTGEGYRVRCSRMKITVAEIPWPGFTGRHYRQALGAGGAPFGPVKQLGGGSSTTADGR
jgi:hypothetical protein